MLLGTLKTWITYDAHRNCCINIDTQCTPQGKYQGSRNSAIFSQTESGSGAGGIGRKIMPSKPAVRPLASGCHGGRCPSHKRSRQWPHNGSHNGSGMYRLYSQLQHQKHLAHPVDPISEAAVRARKWDRWPRWIAEAVAGQ